MTYSRRLISAVLIALMAVPQFFSQAQAANLISMDGSNIVSTIMKAASDAYNAKHPDTKIDVQVSGTNGGFDKLCSGTLDVNMAVRGITDQEAAACSAKNVNYVEVLLGYDASVIVANSASKVTCLATDEAAKLLTPAAAGTIKNWNQVAPALGDLPLATVYAAADTRARDLISTLVAGNTLRGDISLQPTAAAALDKVVAEPNSVAIVSLADYKAATNQSKTVRALDLKNGATCISAEVPNLEEVRYPAGQSLYLYVNVASLARQPVADFMSYVISDEGQAFVTGQGFTLANKTSYTRDQNYLTAKQAGRTFSRIQSVNVASDTQGNVVIDGAPIAAPLLKAVGDAFQPRYTKITVKPTAFGDDVGYRKLCAGTVDIIAATRPLTEAETTACTSNKIGTLQLGLGATGVVILVNASNSFATCLTTDQIAKLFGVASDSKVKKWSDVSDKFPATDLLLVTPADGSNATDLLLMRTVKGVAPLRRRDTTDSDDALYRATGTANVEGAVTYMTYTEFKKVTAKVRPVQVDAGKGCVDATDKTLADGSYALAQNVSLVMNTNAFARPEVKAFVWYLLSEDALTVLADKSDLIGLDKQGFVAARDTVLEKFAQAPVTASGTAAATAPAAPTTNFGLSPITTAVPTAVSTLVPAPTNNAPPPIRPTAAATTAPTASQ